MKARGIIGTTGAKKLRGKLPIVEFSHQKAKHGGVKCHQCKTKSEFGWIQSAHAGWIGVPVKDAEYGEYGERKHNFYCPKCIDKVPKYTHPAPKDDPIEKVLDEINSTEPMVMDHELKTKTRKPTSHDRNMRKWEGEQYGDTRTSGAHLRKKKFHKAEQFELGL